MLTAMLDRRHRGRRRGIPIREGSVRQARLEAGLSLAEVADGQVSRTAIHLIEHGRTLPSFETLQLIARRTRKPLEFFLIEKDGTVPLTQTQSDLRGLEQLTASRAYNRVVELGTRLLERQWSKRDTASIQFQVGQAYCRLMQPEQGLQNIRPARAYFEQTRDESMAIEALDWEAAALGVLEDTEALSLAYEALERCRRLDRKPLDLESRILGHIAAMHVVAQSWAQAVRYYEAAAEAAGQIKDLLQEAKMNHGLGNAYQRMQQPARARRHFDRALALYSLERDLSNIYRVENDLGYLLVQQGQLESAEDHLLRALAGCDAINMDRRGRGFILNSLGELNLLRGDLDVATRCLQQALDAGNAVGERLVQSKAHELFGRVEELKSNRSAADHHFGAAFSLLEQVNMPDRLRDCHMQYAQLLDARGQVVLASHHWRQAAEIGKRAAAGLTLNDRSMSRQADRISPGA